MKAVDTASLAIGNFMNKHPYKTLLVLGTLGAIGAGAVFTGGADIAVAPEALAAEGVGVGAAGLDAGALGATDLGAAASDVAATDTSSGVGIASRLSSGLKGITKYVIKPIGSGLKFGLPVAAAGEFVGLGLSAASQGIGNLESVVLGTQTPTIQYPFPFNNLTNPTVQSPTAPVSPTTTTSPLSSPLAQTAIIIAIIVVGGYILMKKI